MNTQREYPVAHHRSNENNKTEQGLSEPCVLSRPSHNFSRKSIDKDVLKVLYRLKSKGFIAYLVGGCVRDILLNRKPKDFDVCTNATPSQIRRIFRNCRLIGRRFRLAHIVFKGNKIIEVSTFRREPDSLLETEDRRELTIHSNRYYGTPAEDACRRDFTINALFYNIADFSILDYVGGIEDLQRGIIRVIGDPCKRFYEDPVRMMRGLEFAARLDFKLDPDTFKGIKDCHAEICHGSPERIKEEIIAILMSGYAQKCFSFFWDTGIFPSLFPDSRSWDKSQMKCLLDILGQMDSIAGTGCALPEFLCLAAFLWPFIARGLEKKLISQLNDLDLLLRELINPFCFHFAIKIHTRHLIKEIYRTVWRMKRGTGFKGEGRMVRKDFFKEAMMLFRWLAACRQIDQALVKRWDVRIEELARQVKRHRKRYQNKCKRSWHRKYPPG
ncbi:MAG: polynucleotide adenylyltransferase PcnB [bacterium]